MTIFTNRYVQLASAAFVAGVWLVAAREAQASESSTWDVIWGWVGILFEMCAVRHPLGHATLWDWSRPASHPVLLSLAQWGTLASMVGTALTVWARRRHVAR